jgi:hypothetical protein
VRWSAASLSAEITAGFSFSLSLICDDSANHNLFGTTPSLVATAFFVVSTLWGPYIIIPAQASVSDPMRCAE